MTLMNENYQPDPQEVREQLHRMRIRHASFVGEIEDDLRFALEHWAKCEPESMVTIRAIADRNELSIDLEGSASGRS